MESIYNLERSVTGDKVMERIHDYLEKNELSFEVKLENLNFEVSHVVLLDSKGKVVCSGSGKGQNHKIGALTEAIEHFQFWRREREKERILTLDQVLSQGPFKSDYFLMSMGLEYSSFDIAVEEFELFDGQSQILIPTGYIDPDKYGSDLMDFNQLEIHLSKFSSNTGGAFGLNLDDCLLHGLNECVERHYESLLYQDIIGVRSNTEWIGYECHQNQSYKEKADLITEKFGNVMTVFCRTTAGSYAAFAILVNNRDHSIANIGAGSSIFLTLAVQRAIDELGQSLVLNEAYANGDNAWVLEKKRAYKVLSEHKGLYSLINFPIEAFLSFVRLNGDEIHDELPQKVSVKNQINGLVENLKNSNFTPCFKIVYKKDETFVVQVYIPECDKFFVIRRGNLVAPLKSYK